MPDPNQPNQPTLQLTENEEAVIKTNEILITELLEENKKLRRANSRLKNEVRQKNRQIGKLKADKDDGTKTKSNGKNSKKHYKNGKRGTKFNG